MPITLSHLSTKPTSLQAATVPRGDYAALAQGLRQLTQGAMGTLGEVAAEVKAGPHEADRLAKLEKGYHLFTKLCAKSSIHASEIGLALRSYAEPVGKLSGDRIEDYDAVIE